MVDPVLPALCAGEVRVALCVALSVVFSLSPGASAQSTVTSCAGESAPLVPAIARPSERLRVRPERVLKVRYPGNVRRWPIPDRAALEREDAASASRDGAPVRVGVNLPAPGGAVLLEDGRRMTDSSGRDLWTYRVEAPGASALRLHVTRLGDAPDGAELAVADASGAEVEIYAAARAGIGFSDPFWTAPVRGDTAYLEYRAPASDPRPPSIAIGRISYIYRDLRPSGQTQANALVSPPGVLACAVDVMCDAAVPPSVRDAVGLVVFTDAAGTFTCSGALVADLDPNTHAGYLLTANHCIDTPAEAASVAVYWFYQTDVCDGTAPSLLDLPQSRGSTLVATSPETDFTLLRLADDPRDGQGFAGWTTDEPSGALASIHQPDGGHKRISYAELTTEQPICGSWPPSRYWYVDWVAGVSDEGSSGGPLFDASWRLVGQLFGTCSVRNPDCSNPRDYNVLYGKFGVTYPSIAEHLEAVVPDDGYEDNDTPAEAAELPPGTHALRLVDLEDYFAVTLPRPGGIAATVSFSVADLDLDLELSDGSGAVLASSAGTSGTETVAASVGAGTYVLRASKRHKWGGDYTLTVTLELDPLPEPDADADGRADAEDNCPARANPLQEDADGDGLGDACEAFVRGDANADGAIDIGDAVRVLFWLVGDGRELRCDDAADINDDSALDIADVAYALAWLFARGPPPVVEAVVALGACDSDRTADPLECGTFPVCDGGA